MNISGKHMRFSFDDGTAAHLQWPASITLEQLEMLEEVIDLQLQSVRKAIVRRRAEMEAAAAPQIGATGELKQEAISPNTNNEEPHHE